MKYDNGTRDKPVQCFDWSEACDVAVERDRPTWCRVHVDDESDALALVYPSRTYRIMRITPKREVNQ